MRLGAFGIALNLSLLVKMVTREASPRYSLGAMGVEIYAHIELWSTLARQIEQEREV
jgi:hypothetical protein